MRQVWRERALLEGSGWLAGIAALAFAPAWLLTALSDWLPAWIETAGVGSALAAVGAAAGGLLDAFARAWANLEGWVRRNHARAPALMLGLAAVLVIPLLAMLALLARTLARARTRRLSRQAVQPDPATAGADLTAGSLTRGLGDGLTWPVDAWIEIDGVPGSRRPIVTDMLRIGREEDNELILAADTVHRYHAILRRTEDTEIIILDVGPPDGNPMTVNGERKSEARLRNGDVIALGEARLKFTARPS